MESSAWSLRSYFTSSIRIEATPQIVAVLEKQLHLEFSKTIVAALE